MRRIDNIISHTYSKHLVEQIKYIEWYYKDTTAEFTDNDKNQFSFSHNLISNNVRSQHSDIFTPLILECISKCDLDLENYYIYRVRLGLIPKLPKKVIHPKHTDFDVFPEADGNKVILYYVNDSDGDTYFYEGDNVITNKYKKNSLVLFDGTILHSSSSPVNHNIRVAMNINLFRK